MDNNNNPCLRVPKFNNAFLKILHFPGIYFSGVARFGKFESILFPDEIFFQDIWHCDELRATFLCKEC